jgi:hypothetical protein
MRSRLSYYSVLVLVGLGIVSALILTMNPFNGAPASASPAAQSAVTTTVGSGSAPPVSNSPALSAPSGNGLPPGAGFEGDHHHHSDGLPGDDGAAGNSTSTTTTATYISSQNE